jgi:hypothetical protein
MESNHQKYVKNRSTQPESVALYRLRPPGNLIGAGDSHKVHQVLNQIQDEVNRAFANHKKGRVNCTTEDYKICISKLNDSLIINVKCRNTKNVLLSQSSKVGDFIVI